MIIRLNWGFAAFSVRKTSRCAASGRGVCSTPLVGCGMERNRELGLRDEAKLILGGQVSECVSGSGHRIIPPCTQPRTWSTMKRDGHRGPNGRKAEKAMGRLRESRRTTSRAGRTLCITSNRRIVCPTRWHRESFRRKSAARTTAAARPR